MPTFQRHIRYVLNLKVIHSIVLMNLQIHLLYINSSNQLVEKVKKLSSNTWESVTLEDAVKKGPEPNSRLAGAAYNFDGGWNPEGSQWVYYTTFVLRFHQHLLTLQFRSLANVKIKVVTLTMRKKASLKFAAPLVDPGILKVCFPKNGAKYS